MDELRKPTASTRTLRALELPARICDTGDAPLRARALRRLRDHGLELRTRPRHRTRHVALHVHRRRAHRRGPASRGPVLSPGPRPPARCRNHRADRADRRRSARAAHRCGDRHRAHRAIESHRRAQRAIRSAFRRTGRCRPCAPCPGRARCARCRGPRTAARAPPCTVSPVSTGSSPETATARSPTARWACGCSRSTSRARSSECWRRFARTHGRRPSGCGRRPRISSARTSSGRAAIAGCPSGVTGSPARGGPRSRPRRWRPSSIGCASLSIGTGDSPTSPNGASPPATGGAPHPGDVADPAQAAPTTAAPLAAGTATHRR